MQPSPFERASALFKRRQWIVRDELDDTPLVLCAFMFTLLCMFTVDGINPIIK